MDQTVPAYAAEVADYGRSRDPEPGEGALVKNVRPESPAWDVGIEPGMRVLTVNGEQLTDMIVWLWEADDDTVDLEVFDPRDNTVTSVELDRFPGEDWGLEFDGPIFDGMRTCVNACVFCFMTMLPKGGRSTLYIRDDDYRLSFLQGNFVTLTNLSDEDVQNVIDRNMSPMNVSVHAVSPDVRRRMMGRNAQRGMDVLEAIMARRHRDSRADCVVPRHERRRGAGKDPALLRGARANHQPGHRAARFYQASEPF